MEYGHDEFDDGFDEESAAALDEIEQLPKRPKSEATLPPPDRQYGSADQPVQLEAEDSVCQAVEGTAPASVGINSQSMPTSPGAPSMEVCFKCQQVGHWARYCPSLPANAAPSGMASFGSPSRIPAAPEMACPCGQGPCTVLTSNTARNPNRQFFRCPKRENEGGCKFFQWVDELQQSANCAGSSASVGGLSPNGAPTQVPVVSPARSAIVSPERARTGPEMACPCGQGPCMVLTSNTARNPNRQFFRCPKRENEGGCKFFQWVDEPPRVAGANAVGSVGGGGAYDGPGAPTGGGGTDVCFKCQQPGHWASRCPNQGATMQLDAKVGGCVPTGGWNGGGGYNAGGGYNGGGGYTGGASGGGGFNGGDNCGSLGFASAIPVASDVCFKCQQPGHWASRCPNQGGKGGGGRGSAVCHKCQQPGHWASSCPNNSNKRAYPSFR